MDNLDIEQRLWEYIDGLTTGDERLVVERLIGENKQWRDTYQELLQVHQMLESTELEQPSLRFTKNVMEELAKHHIAPTTKAYINAKIIWVIAGFFVLSILGFLVFGLGQIDWTTAPAGDSALGIDFNKIQYSKVFNSTMMNVFMMLNAVLGLMLLDRYLSNKRGPSPTLPDRKGSVQSGL